VVAEEVVVALNLVINFKAAVVAELVVGDHLLLFHPHLH
jgi:hypothetical protein